MPGDRLLDYLLLSNVKKTLRVEIAVGTAASGGLRTDPCEKNNLIRHRLRRLRKNGSRQLLKFQGNATSVLIDACITGRNALTLHLEIGLTLYSDELAQPC